MSVHCEICGGSGYIRLPKMHKVEPYRVVEAEPLNLSSIVNDVKTFDCPECRQRKAQQNADSTFVATFEAKSQFDVYYE